MLTRRKFMILATLLVPELACSGSLSLDDISEIGLSDGFDTRELEKVYSDRQWQQYINKEYQDDQPFPDQKAQSSLEKIAQPLFPTSTRKELKWRISLNTKKDINACTYGGGVIFINLGLVRACKNQIELASVIAHEIGHVEYMHSIKSYLNHATIRQYNIALDMNAIRRQSPQATTSLDIVLKYVHEIVYQSYSRLDEFEADAFILRAFLQTGYPLNQASSFNKTMIKMGGEAPQGVCLFSTHPEMKERANRLDRLAATYNSNPIFNDSTAFKYLKTI
jgi:predicted Zn-dependent protease